MFASLKYYKQQSYWAQHPRVYITDDNGAHCYEIFAAYEISTAGDTYKLSFPTNQSKQAYIDYCLEKSVIDTGLTPTVYDKILTLSTCTGNGHATRWVVQALLRGEAPPAAQEQPEEVPAQTEEPAKDAGQAQPSEGTAASGETVVSGGETASGETAVSGGESTAPDTDPAAEAAGSQGGSAGEAPFAEAGQDAPQTSAQDGQPEQSARTAPE
jgi:sortase B